MLQAEAPCNAVGTEHSKGDSVHSAGSVEDGGSNEEDDAAAGGGNDAAAEVDDEDYWDEEDELAIDFQRELAGGGEDNTPAPSGERSRRSCSTCCRRTWQIVMTGI